jgi:hypothetical protein
VTVFAAGDVNAKEQGGTAPVAVNGEVALTGSVHKVVPVSVSVKVTVPVGSVVPV